MILVRRKVKKCLILVTGTTLGLTMMIICCFGIILQLACMHAYAC